MGTAAIAIEVEKFSKNILYLGMQKKFIQPLEKKHLYREKIKDEILELILSNNLRPGDRIVETHWAKQLGVSQSPVREAIQELTLLGIVENIPYKGTFVRKLTYHEILETYNIRELLEWYAVDSAVSKITDEQISFAENLLNSMRKAAVSDDYNMYISSDVMFHQHFINIVDNSLLLRLWNQCNIPETTRIGTRYSKFAMDVLAERHMDIFNAYKKRDAEAAKAAIIKHFDLLKEDLCSQEIK